jgi:hypothetical protein
MKNFINILLAIFLIPVSLKAQSQFELTYDAQKVGNDLQINYYVQKINGPDFALGAANLPFIKTNDADLAWSQIQPDPSYTSPFGAAANATSYEPLRMSTAKYVHMTIMPKWQGTGSGFLVTSNKVKVGSYLVPITGTCAETELYWEKNRGAINLFNTLSQANSIRSDAVFTDLAETTIRLFDFPTSAQIKEPDTLIACEGKTIALNTAPTSFNIQWYRDGIAIPGANNSIFDADVSGNYAVELSNCNVEAISDPVDIQITPLPQQAMITENNGILTSSVATGIQWYHNGVAIPNATSNQLIPSNSGIYTVKSFNDCGEIFSDPYNYAPLGVDFAQNGPSLHVFPNPYIGKTNIEVTLSSDSELTIEVYDLKGNLVNLVKEGFFEAGKHQLEFSAQELGWAAGTYVLKVRTDEKELIQNLVELK